MNTITTTVETANAVKLCEYVHQLKHEATQLIGGNTAAERLVGSSIWSIADKMDMLLNKAFGFPAMVSSNVG